jgi:hypothetical protein
MRVHGGSFSVRRPFGHAAGASAGRRAYLAFEPADGARAPVRRLDGAHANAVYVANDPAAAAELEGNRETWSFGVPLTVIESP